jgi:hypothetical protein
MLVYIFFNIEMWVAGRSFHPAYAGFNVWQPTENTNR